MNYKRDAKEPFWWGMFSAGGVVAALLIPIHIFIDGYLVHPTVGTAVTARAEGIKVQKPDALPLPPPTALPAKVTQLCGRALVRPAWA